MPTPAAGESKKDYVSRCIGVRQNEHPDEGVDQSTAICNSMWTEAKKMETIKEIKEPPILVADNLGGIAAVAAPDSVVPGSYPEFEAVELPEELTKKPWERDWK